MSFLPVRIYKMSGAGNTFVLIDARTNSKWASEEPKLNKKRSELAEMICHRIYGVAADGLVFIQDGSDRADYVWDFYNSDGSHAEMCGNAARCAGRFCYEILDKMQNPRITFQTGAGLVDAVNLDSGVVRVKMPLVDIKNSKQRLTVAGKDLEFFWVNTGVPHLVLQIQNMSQALELKSLAATARSHIDLGPHGANVTLVAVESSHGLQAVTFERGVEDFTPACGTGAVAAAAWFYSQHSEVRQIDVTMPGGPLVVHFDSANDKQAYLEGDAIFIGEFNYSLEAFR